MEIIKASTLSEEKRLAFAGKMKSCDWDAGQWLGNILEDNAVEKNFGEGSEVLLLTENGELTSFCTYAAQDEIDDLSLTPWAGFVYTFPEHRGHRYAGLLLDCAKETARKNGYRKLYVSSEEKGLYEKYGFTYMTDMPSVHGYTTQVFVCDLYIRRC